MVLVESCAKEVLGDVPFAGGPQGWAILGLLRAPGVLGTERGKVLVVCATVVCFGLLVGWVLSLLPARTYLRVRLCAWLVAGILAGVAGCLAVYVAALFVRLEREDAVIGILRGTPAIYWKYIMAGVAAGWLGAAAWCWRRFRKALDPFRASEASSHPKS